MSIISKITMGMSIISKMQYKSVLLYFLVLKFYKLKMDVGMDVLIMV